LHFQRSDLPIYQAHRTLSLETQVLESEWVGGLAEWVEGDTAHLSVAFTWKLREARDRAQWYRALGYKVLAWRISKGTRRWLLGVPIWALLHSLWPEAFTPGDPAVLIPNHSILDGIAQAAIVFAITYVFIFVLRLFIAPAKLFKAEQDRALALRCRLREEELETDRIAAIREQTQEMRVAREQRERDNDPHLKAFNETKFREALAGVPSAEQVLGQIIMWITNCSSWGRWQAAQTHVEVGNTQVQRHAEIHLLDMLQRGTIPARGIRASDGNYEFISPDFWKNVYLMTFFDNITIIKTRIFPRSVTSPCDSDEISDKTYKHVFCEWAKIVAAFPQKDAQMDARTDSLLGST
jgi:hypothetical protein